MESRIVHDPREIIRLALPKGRYAPLSERILSSLGVREADSGRLQFSVGHGARAYLLKSSDIGGLLEQSLFDFSILPQEHYLEVCAKVPTCKFTVVTTVKSFRTRMAFFGAPGTAWPPVNAISVVSPFPNLTNRLLREAGINTSRIFPVIGSSEAFVPDLADVGFDCVETGSTLLVNNLIELCAPLSSLTLTLIARDRSLFNSVHMNFLSQLQTIISQACDL